MKTVQRSAMLALAVALSGILAAGSWAQSQPTVQDIVEALKPYEAKDESSEKRGFFGKKRNWRGVKASGGKKGVPSIDLKVNFGFDSAKLDNEATLTLDVLGRALSSKALRGQAIQIVGHTDAKGTPDYNAALSERRAAAVVGYIVSRFSLNQSLISSKGMGESQLLDKDNPESSKNRRVEIRNVTQALSKRCPTNTRSC